MTDHNEQLRTTAETKEDDKESSGETSEPLSARRYDAVSYNGLRVGQTVLAYYRDKLASVLRLDNDRVRIVVNKDSVSHTTAETVISDAQAEVKRLIDFAYPETTPNVEDSVVRSLIVKHSERAAKGKAKYGVTLDRNDLTFSDWLTHLQEEMMDAALYVEKILASKFATHVDEIQHLMLSPREDAYALYSFIPYDSAMALKLDIEKYVAALDKSAVSYQRRIDTFKSSDGARRWAKMWIVSHRTTLHLRAWLATGHAWQHDLLVRTSGEVAEGIVSSFADNDAVSREITRFSECMKSWSEAVNVVIRYHEQGQPFVDATDKPDTVKG